MLTILLSQFKRRALFAFIALAVVESESRLDIVRGIFGLEFWEFYNYWEKYSEDEEEEEEVEEYGELL